MRIRLLPASRKALSFALALAFPLTSGCGSITGFANALSDFGCSIGTGNPTCRPISAVYAENNPASARFEGLNAPAPKTPPFKEKPSEAKAPGPTSNGSTNLVASDGTPVSSLSAESGSCGPAGAPESAPCESTEKTRDPSPLPNTSRPPFSDPQKEGASSFVTRIAPRPWRVPETVLRVWLAPFVDRHGDLHDERYVFVRLNNGGWAKASVSEAGAQKPDRIVPLSREKPDAAAQKREALKKLPPFGARSPFS